MSLLMENIIYNIVASIIYDVGKCGLGQLKCLKRHFLKDNIKKYVSQRLDEKYDMLCESEIFTSFLKNPLVIDTISNYVTYIITGNVERHLLNNIKKNKHQIIEEKEIVNFLANNLIKKCQDDKLTLKSTTLIKDFFSELFKICSEYILEQMRKEEVAMIYFVNRKMSIMGGRIFSALEDIVNILNRSIKLDIIDTDEKMIKNKEYYTKVLKENNKMAHIYLLDKFDINQFYVPPFLTQFITQNIDKQGVRSRDLHSYIYMHRNTNFIEEQFDDWKHIFERSNIIYVTGGAGYGKSLLMKKIIEEYNKLNLINSEEYMIIYGELKLFFTPNSDIPLPVIDFLQNSMKKETLIEEEIVSKDLINFYLKRGRCIILLDALDEVEKSKRSNLHELVVNYFKNQNPNNKVCITSRARGFLPEKDVEVFEIEPLDSIQIETYVDNIINLGKFDKKDRESFLKQTKILVKKGFLNSFLVLSLLINIYKAERELPENKLDLYQKCFEYIANKREKAKSQDKYDWKLISILMKDNTFMELANMCLPNNNDVRKDDIKENLANIYRAKYTSENETEIAIDQFLQFCSDRTELFVPASGEDCFKFFHRSFFEYFYSQYIFTRLQSTEKIYDALSKFDVDSEVFELTLAMYKQKNENKYQEIIQYILEKMNNNNLKNEVRLNAINVFILGLQVIDDELYIEKFVDFLVNNYDFCITNISKLHNQTIIVEVIDSRKNYYEKVCKKYKSNAIFEAIVYLLEMYPEVIRIIDKKVKQKQQGIENKFNKVFRGIYNFNFYSQIFFKHISITSVFEKLNSTYINRLGKDCNISQKEINKIKYKYNKYLNLNAKKRHEVEKILLTKP